MGVCNCMSRNKYTKFENKIDNRKNDRNKQNYVDLLDIDISKTIDYIAWPNKKVDFLSDFISKIIKYIIFLHRNMLIEL